MAITLNKPDPNGFYPYEQWLDIVLDYTTPSKKGDTLTLSSSDATVHFDPKSAKIVLDGSGQAKCRLIVEQASASKDIEIDVRSSSTQEAPTKFTLHFKLFRLTLTTDKLLAADTPDYADPNPLDADKTILAKVTVKDEMGNTLSGVPVNFNQLPSVLIFFNQVNKVYTQVTPDPNGQYLYKTDSAGQAVAALVAKQPTYTTIGVAAPDNNPVMADAIFMSLRKGGSIEEPVYPVDSRGNIEISNTLPSFYVGIVPAGRLSPSMRTVLLLNDEIVYRGTANISSVEVGYGLLQTGGVQNRSAYFMQDPASVGTAIMSEIATFTASGTAVVHPSPLQNRVLANVPYLDLHMPVVNGNMIETDLGINIDLDGVRKGEIVKVEVFLNGYIAGTSTPRPGKYLPLPPYTLTAADVTAGTVRFTLDRQELLHWAANLDGVPGTIEIDYSIDDGSNPRYPINWANLPLNTEAPA